MPTTDPKSRPVRWPDDLLRYIWAARRESHPVPVPGVFDAPYTCVMVNASWASHVIGALDILSAPDAWQGSETEVYTAQQEVEKLLNAVSIGSCDDVPGITDMRVNGCNLEVEYNNSGAWVVVGDLSACAVPGPKGDTGDPGPMGPPGEKGDPGDPGADGQDGVCNCGTPTNTPGEDGSEKRCNVASYLSEIVLPDIVDDSLDTNDNANTAADFGMALASAAAGFFVAGPAGAAVGLTFALSVGDFITDLWNIDTTLIRNELSNQYWLDIKCRLYCAMPDEGILTQEVLNALADEVGDLPGYPNLNYMMPIIIRNLNLETAGRISTVGALYAGNCDICECPGEAWCITFDFLANDGGWLADYPDREGRGRWELGTGWISTNHPSNDGIYLTRELGVSTTITGIEFTYYGAHDFIANVQQHDGSGFISVAGPQSNSPVTASGSMNWPNTTKILFNWTTWPDTEYITRITLTGTGPVPQIGDVCP